MREACLNRLQFELSQLLQPPCSCPDRDVPDSASFGVPVFKGCHGSDEEPLFRKMLLDVSEELAQRVFRYVFQNLPTRNQIEPDRTISMDRQESIRLRGIAREQTVRNHAPVRPLGEPVNVAALDAHGVMTANEKIEHQAAPRAADVEEPDPSAFKNAFSLLTESRPSRIVVDRSPWNSVIVATQRDRVIGLQIILGRRESRSDQCPF